MGLFEQLKATPRWQERRELVHACNDAAALLAWLPMEIEGWVRAPMASKFGQLGGPEAHKALEVLAQDESGMVRIAAVGALNTLATLEARFQIRETYTRDEDHHVRHAVVQSDVPVGQSEALGTLHATLDYETDPQKRALAIYWAALAAGKVILPNLHWLWQTENAPEVRQQLAELLASLGGEVEQQLLVRGLTEELSPRVRADLIRLLEKYRGELAREAFLHALPIERDDAVRAALVRALSRWDDREVLEALYKAQEHHATDQTRLTTQAAHQELEKKISQQSGAELLAWLAVEPTAELRNRLLQALCERAPITIDGLREFLVAAIKTEHDDRVRASMVRTLGYWHDDEVLEQLYVLLSEILDYYAPTDPMVRYTRTVLLMTLKSFYERQEVATLDIQLTAEAHYLVRSLLFRALHNRNTVEAREAMLRALSREQHPGNLLPFCSYLRHWGSDTALSILRECSLRETDAEFQKSILQTIELLENAFELE